MPAAGTLMMERRLQLPVLGQRRLQLPWRTAEGGQGTPPVSCPGDKSGNAGTPEDGVDAVGAGRTGRGGSWGAKLGTPDSPEIAVEAANGSTEPSADMLPLRSAARPLS